MNRNVSTLTTIRGWLSPTGGFIDAVRLAVINSMFLFSAVMLAFILALLARLVRLVLPAPNISPGIVVLILSIVFGLIVWYRYAVKHRQLAQASGKAVHPDRFGIIGGSPFALLALLLLGSGVFGLAISVAGLNVGGVSAAVGRLIFAGLFAMLAAASVGIARLAMRGAR